MKQLENKTVADIVTDNINTAKVFNKFSINFGFRDKITLKTVCEEKNVDLKDLIDELKKVDKSIYYLKDYKSWNIDLLLQFLIDIHHNKKQDDIQILTKLSKEINNKIKTKSKTTEKLYKLIENLNSKVLNKIHIEEDNVFPYIKELLLKKKNTGTLKKPILEESLKKIEKQRETLSKKIDEIIQLTNNFKTSKTVDASLKLLFERLGYFLFVLQEHNHIEKNILFPKALELEASLVG